MEFKVNISDPKTGKTHKKVLQEEDCKQFLNKKIGDVVAGESLGLAGYQLKITGGSDYCGFPMRADVVGTMRRRILIAGGVGIRSKRKGMRKRKMVAGSEIFAQTAQINLTIVKYGKAPIDPEAEKAEAVSDDAKPKDVKSDDAKPKAAKSDDAKPKDVKSDGDKSDDAKHKDVKSDDKSEAKQ